MDDLYLYGYLNFNGEDNANIVFVRPIYKKGNNYYRLKLSRNGLASFYSYVLIDIRYVDDINCEISSHLENKSSIDLEKPDAPLYMFKFDSQLFFGSIIEILESLFKSYKYSFIRKYDNECLLIHFMLKNYDNTYLPRYFEGQSKEDFVYLLIEIFNSEELETIDKYRMINYLCPKFHESSNDSCLLLKITDSDILELKAKVIKKKFIRRIEKVRMTAENKKALTIINNNKEASRKEFKERYEFV